MDDIVTGGLYTFKHYYNANDPFNGRVMKVTGFAGPDAFFAAEHPGIRTVETVTDDEDAIKCLCLETELVPVA